MKHGLSTAMQSNVLAVNRLYLAIHVITVRRAFALLWKGMAEVINIEDGAYMAYDFDAWRETSELRSELDEMGENTDWILAVNFPIQVPRIVRLLHYDRIPRETVKFSRKNVFLRDENRCQYCRRQFNMQQLSLDHVLPRSRGGDTSWENVVTACLRCNVRKGGRTPLEAGMSLGCRPAKPKRNPALAHQLSFHKYESWRSFIR